MGKPSYSQISSQKANVQTNFIIIYTLSFWTRITHAFSMYELNVDYHKATLRYYTSSVIKLSTKGLKNWEIEKMDSSEQYSNVFLNMTTIHK